MPNPPKPGLIRCGEGNGVSIELEVWELPVEHFGSFVALVAPPLSIGTSNCLKVRRSKVSCVKATPLKVLVTFQIPAAGASS